MKKRYGYDGFTLLEVMIAIMILGTSLVVLLESHSASIRLSGASRKIIIATQLARMKMAEIELDDELSEGTENGDFGNDFKGYRWQYEVIDDTLTFTILPGMPEVELQVKRVTLVVYWKDGLAEQSFVLESLITDKRSEFQGQGGEPIAP